MMSHEQDDDKVNCSGDPADASPVFVRVTDEEDPDDERGRVYFEGAMALGDTFLADAGAADEDRFRSRTYAHVFAADGELLQSVEFHTSCSQPLAVGDQSGSILVTEFYPEEGGRKGLEGEDERPGNGGLLRFEGQLPLGRVDAPGRARAAAA